MSKKTLSSVSVLILLAGSFVSLANAQTTTQDTIAKFADPLGNLTDSVIIEDPVTGYIGIGTASPSYKLHVVGGSSAGVVGQSTSNIGVVGNSNDSVGVAASTNNPTSPALSVSSAGFSPNNAGLTVFGRTFLSGGVGIGGSAPDAKLQVTVSTPEESLLTAVQGVQNGAGAWGGIGVYGHSTNGPGVVGRSDNFSYGGVQAHSYQSSPSNLALQVFGRFTATGTKNAVVPLSDGQQILMYSEESTEVWFSDYGSVRLADGRATVQIDPKFLQTVNTADKEYHVFLTANGNPNGALYINHQTPDSFEIRETTGSANTKVSYRIVAKRKDFADERMKSVAFQSVAFNQ